MITNRPWQLWCSAFIFLLFSSFNLLAQQTSEMPRYTVTGKVTDEGGIPLEYATISFQSTRNPEQLTGGITDPQGNFAIEVPRGTYNINIEFISFEPKNFANRQINSDLDMGTIVLGMAAGELDEVVVTAETTQVEVRLDKKIYNIGKDLTTAGGTVADALNNVPSVSVDIEGGISLRGNENVRILINGKPSAMAGFGNTDVLSQLPAEAIERVEVITSPSARYDAEGTAGILNIILKKEKTLGFNGSVSARVGHPDQVGLSANVNYRTNKFNLFNTTGFRYFDAPGMAYSDTRYFEYTDADGELVTPSFDRLIEDRQMDRLNRNFYTSLGMEYYLTDRSSITATGFYRYGEDEDLTTNNSLAFKDGMLETLRKENQIEDDNSYQIALNYINKFNDSGHQLTADLQYERDEETQNANINEVILSNTTSEPAPFYPLERTYTEESQNEILIQTDYVKPIGEDAQFEAGYRGNFEEEITDYQLLLENRQTGDLELSPLTNIFTYTENVNSLYSQYGNKFGEFSFLLGLRLENTQLKGKIESELTEEELQEEFGIPIDTDFDNNYLGLFPTVNLIYELGEQENVTLGYNRRINRPRGWFINPFPSRASRTNIFQGNPNLQPAYSDAFDLGYLKRWKKLTLTSSVYYQYETDSFERVEQISTVEDDEGNNNEVIRTIPINLATNQRVGAEAGLLYNPAKWLRLNGSVNFFQFDTEGEYNGVDYSAKNTSWYGRFSSKVTLPAKIDWQTNAFYRGASEGAQTERQGIFMIDMAMSKELFNDKASLTLNVRDLLNSRKRDAYTLTKSFERNSEFQWRQRSITLSFTYRFNQQRNERERRRGENGNEDMEGGEGEF
ncbi:Outer membrane receptor proteins, mostly Fe transport [Salinimicrobium catena]|uniref:Outer membrane receptor proteins, mostly Fe transport n=1 Tax=Salinimicrobium catena TaxID=390640 RepID=A0A1H5KX40_9FLAO|nr:outer membrane beta-barrel family protein [Salinimicrobium catena]SDL02988.1 Outer membrane receptor proteins, mostly Fe transport [Salinimicrobium catena]SEE69260.1 Outer membrane receptor proteins, mostly Fe transport [Salinimicrobium catena]